MCVRNRPRESYVTGEDIIKVGELYDMDYGLN
jgi:hypothetical protein